MRRRLPIANERMRAEIMLDADEIIQKPIKEWSLDDATVMMAAYKMLLDES